MATTKKSKALATQKNNANLAIQFGEDEVELIKKTICPGASDTECNLFLYDAQSRGLNPLRKEIYWVQRMVYDPETRQKVSKASHQVGIDGFRKIAQSSGEYQGQTGVRYGNDLSLYGLDVPEYAEVGVYRKGFVEPLYARAYFVEYAQAYNGKLGSMWAKMPRLMIAKCAESLALRKAFPDSLAGLYTNDEMGQAENAEATHKPVPKFEAVDIETGEVKAEAAKAVDAVQCATRTQEKTFNELMDELGQLMGWGIEKSKEMALSTLQGLGKVDKFEDLSKVMAEKLIEKVAEKVEEKKPATAQDVADAFEGEVI